VTARASAQRHAETTEPTRRGVDTGECIVSDRAPFCWRGCDSHFWQHLPGQWSLDDDFDDDGGDE
jgi:hypothetical protein